MQKKAEKNGSLTKEERLAVKCCAERLGIAAFPFSLPSRKEGSGAVGKRKSSTHSSRKDISVANEEDERFSDDFTPPRRKSSEKDGAVELDDGRDGFDDN